MTRLKLNLACWDYDRTRPLIDGRVTPDEYIGAITLMMSHPEAFEATVMSTTRDTVRWQDRDGDGSDRNRHARTDPPFGEVPENDREHEK